MTRVANVLCWPMLKLAFRHEKLCCYIIFHLSSNLCTAQILCLSVCTLNKQLDRERQWTVATSSSLGNSPLYQQRRV